MKELTVKQSNLLDYLDKYIKKNGRTPSLRHLAGDLGISHAAVAQLMNALEKKKAIMRNGKYGRHIKILASSYASKPNSSGREIPLVGIIAAGLPLYAQEDWQGAVLVDERLYKGNNLFALRIKGDSMKDAAILDGDIAICEPRQFAENGEIVVALINNEEATVKRIFLKKNYILLKPENEKFKPIKYPFNEILIQGKVVGIIRSQTRL